MERALKAKDRERVEEEPVAAAADKDRVPGAIVFAQNADRNFHMKPEIRASNKRAPSAGRP